ncbi:molybdopterin-guanine dinucleotide biosynthesis protein B [Paenibacillus pasadenensis]|uniref:molybdopterin-guanine dinucleotide biosynthesis protein B n=1 Tax=Paenibacillus pasadenensis TaxID=217090 RepID=UPI00204058B7|nr:molybdopterin-guanine dinucleotide biosynthesis protein B [Paenibacillus pasadenensis]MCM3748650.1 molybdopterin-guanine dinucleotide biosynthesis protein B [Paenibacillus pasadenensis]
MKTVIQLVGYKNTGKTTLLCRLAAQLRLTGLSVASIKHDGHEFEDERPGCDTRRFREAGAYWSAVSSSSRTVVVMESGSTLAELIGLTPQADFILVEGFKREIYPKLLLARCEEDLQLLPSLHEAAAVLLWPELYAKRRALALPEGIAIILIDDTESILDLIMKQYTGKEPEPIHLLNNPLEPSAGWSGI